jgi:hypothetical protein
VPIRKTALFREKNIEQKLSYIEFPCESGFPAAISLLYSNLNRGWKAAPTIKIRAKQTNQKKMSN